jgi:hypothetical protein
MTCCYTEGRTANFIVGMMSLSKFALVLCMGGMIALVVPPSTHAATPVSSMSAKRKKGINLSWDKLYRGLSGHFGF